MALDLLNCSICPGQPSFSDTSHLLTHVSSKGHLSEFHKLQVRSYQDIAAGVELAKYNHWYQQHDIDRLLSERMQMKENKQAKKKRASAATRNTCEPQPGIFDYVQLNQPLPPRRPGRPKAQTQTQTQRRSTRNKQATRAVDDSDSDFSPVKPSRRRTSRLQAYSPIKQSPFSDDDYPSRNDRPAEDNRPAPVLATPEHMKLKGTVWPGMDLFDAATQEMQQKRNQKKDASVLRRMERLAALVEPTEVVFSPRGTNVLKARHIDDLEDGSSLVEGETPVPKVKQPPRPRKRRPLAEKDVNAPRLVKRKVKAGVPKRYADLPFAQGLPPLPYLPSSSTGDSYGLGSRYFPTEDEEEDIKPAMQSLAPHKRPPFEVFADGSPTYHASMSRSGNRNPLQSGSRGYGNTTFQQLPKVSTPWLHPPYQSALQFTDPFASYRPVSQEYHAFYETHIENENMPPLPGPPLTFRGTGTNPLAWKSPVRPPTDPGLPPSDSPFSSIFALFPSGSPDDDPFVMTKNPLAGALPHLESEQPHVLVKEMSIPLANTGTSNDAEA
ncbi:hypothetical protein Z517_02143 [Fonsecaea pedrosoi CBS 271.37]|uniref:Uncharacterized protein n=1 Tax=Fonsecaea pedrosoi CBS 271.37 TaxID=1442368 RepID=A0A0D2GWA3_9EURO|nr:uncharacterized protein Z517_02143 [Fonsecaea pedrosoi CBS 271.37]KIW82900.1 hypothetical protein Z517_02143 [Fonsecaea pedrosoi CBS 271.37]